MAEASDIPADALVLRHIPGGGTTFQQPQTGYITSQNFKLRPEERGISVSLSAEKSLVVDAGAMLVRLRTHPDSKIAYARLEKIRELGFQVVRTPTPDDPNHSDLISGVSGFDDPKKRKLLAAEFRYVILPHDQGDSSDV